MNCKNIKQCLFQYFDESFGEENKKLPTREIGHLVEKHKNYVYAWGSEVSDKPIYSVKTSTVKTFVKKGRDAGRISFPFDSVNNVLCKLHLVKGLRIPVPHGCMEKSAKAGKKARL